MLKISAGTGRINRTYMWCWRDAHSCRP